MTAQLDDQILARAQQLQAEQVLPKPFSLAELVASVKRLLDSAYGRSA
jgi:DNA-binding response OmpR family regulator